MKLTDDQLKAIHDVENNSVIMACPGSGKTTVLINKMSLCCEKLKRHNGIIGLSFTRKSSEELRKKFKIKSKKYNLNYLGTIDSFLVNEIIRPFLPKIWAINVDDFEVVRVLSEEESIPFSQEYTNRQILLIDIETDSAFKGLFLEGKVWEKSVTSLALFVIKNVEICRRYISCRYKYLFVDEYQDTSNIQHLLFLELLSLGLKFTAVGDIDQSIYQWRDAVPKNLTSLATDHGFHEYTIDVNHRCDPSIDLYARIFLTENDKEPLVDQKIFRIHINDIDKHRYAKLDDLIKTIKDENQFEYSDFAILAAKSAPLEHYIQNTRHNYKIYEDSPLDNMNHYLAQLCSDLIFYKYNKNSSAYLIYEAYKVKLKNIKFNEFKNEVKKLRLEDDVGEICKNIEKIIRKIDSNINIENFILATKSISDNEHYIKLYQPTNPNDLQVMTIHKAKGLEFKVVIHIGMEAWVFPSKTKINGNWENADIVADKCLHYVAITRAEKLCYLVNMPFRITKDKITNDLNEKSAEKSDFLRIQRLDKHIIDLGVR